MSTMRVALNVNERCVCAVPPPGNLMTGPAATSPFRSTILSGCQLPSMPCSSNYRLWLRSPIGCTCAAPCSRTNPALQETTRPLCGYFEEPETSSLVFYSPADTPQTTQTALTSGACFYLLFGPLNRCQENTDKHRVL